jgi:hypothetical protein
MSEPGASNNPAPQSGGAEANSSGGRSARGRALGGRGRGRGSAGRNNNRSAAVGRNNTSEKCDGLKGNVFQCHGENTDKQQFLKTVGVLDEHINKTFDYPQDVASVCDSFEITPLVQPSNLSKEDYEKDMGKKMMWETSMKSFMKSTDLQESNARAIYAIVWGQCSPMMQSKIESLDDFSDKNATRDCAWLLKEI